MGMGPKRVVKGQGVHWKVSGGLVPMPCVRLLGLCSFVGINAVF